MNVFNHAVLGKRLPYHKNIIFPQIIAGGNNIILFLCKMLQHFRGIILKSYLKRVGDYSSGGRAIIILRKYGKWCTGKCINRLEPDADKLSNDYNYLQGLNPRGWGGGGTPDFK